MIKYIKADINHKADIIDFINYVFSYDHRPHDFKKLVPKIYADDADTLDVSHYLVMEHDKILAVISLLNLEVRVGRELLKYGLIGNVAVHPYARGRHYVRNLLEMAIKDAKTADVDIMVLGGQRQRYGCYGFEPAGAVYKFIINKTNIRYGMKNVECSNIAFELITDPQAKVLDTAKEFYEKRAIYAIRSRKDFLHIMHSWENEIHLVKKDGRMIGYIYGNACELVLDDDSYLSAVIKAWFEQKKVEAMDIFVPAYEEGRVSYFSGICESMSVNSLKQVCVLNWERVLRVMLGFKHEFCPLQNGEAEFCIEEDAFQMRVCGGKVYVEKICERAFIENKNILHLTQNEAERMFFGLQNVLNPKAGYRNWLPVPFCIDVPDLF